MVELNSSCSLDELPFQKILDSNKLLDVNEFNGDLVLWRAVKNPYVKRNANAKTRNMKIFPNTKLNIICYKKIRMLQCML